MKILPVCGGWLLACLLLALPLLAAPLHAATALDYAAAKALADTDEASMDVSIKESTLIIQRAFLDTAVKACATDQATARLEDFVVVMRLDGNGQVAETWRRGDSPLALCVERHSRGKTLFAPPRSPFYTSLEVNFVK
ncbi:MAG: hypothetical protein ACOH1R_03015 [Luteimonas sp.]